MYVPLKQVRVSSKALSFFEIIRIKHDETSKKGFRMRQRKSASETNTIHLVYIPLE